MQNEERGQVKMLCGSVRRGVTIASMRVVSLVPSWSETLAECGVNLVGRTRFCVHPDDAAFRDLPVLGGTKNLDEDRLRELRPDLLIVDREENLPWMAERAPCPVFVSHVTSLEDLADELRKLSGIFDATTAAGHLLEAWATRARAVTEHPTRVWDFQNVPGALETIVPVTNPPRRLEYVIWRRPWMKIGPGTYIHSVLKKLGAEEYLVMDGAKYPEFEMETLGSGTFLMFSSEPYAFANRREELRALRDDQGQSRPSALVDGEAYGWFGVRGLRFLEDSLGIKTVG